LFDLKNFKTHSNRRFSPNFSGSEVDHSILPRPIQGDNDQEELAMYDLMLCFRNVLDAAMHDGQKHESGLLDVMLCKNG
jgi:hypothetical protein